jgi:hypothetical protein
MFPLGTGELEGYGYGVAQQAHSPLIRQAKAIEVCIVAQLFFAGTVLTKGFSGRTGAI